jgi:hypothetical protein
MRRCSGLAGPSRNRSVPTVNSSVPGGATLPSASTIVKALSAFLPSQKTSPLLGHRDQIGGWPGSPRISCGALPSPTFCRFIPALSLRPLCSQDWANWPSAVRAAAPVLKTLGLEAGLLPPGRLSTRSLAYPGRLFPCPARHLRARRNRSRRRPPCGGKHSL